MSDIKAFNRWDCSQIKVEDAGLARYMNLNPVIVPKTGARYAGNRFHKSRVFIVERLINRVMIAGHKGKKHKTSTSHTTGKSATAYDLVEKALIIIEEKTKMNPIEVFAKSIENAAPREEIVSIEYGGARYPKAVECSPQRRIDVVLKMMTQGAYQKAFKNKKAAEECLADEIIAAYKLQATSNAIAKKLELERQADASK